MTSSPPVASASAIPRPRARDRVVGALDHEHRAADAAAELAHGLLVEASPPLRRDERLGRRLEAPADAVLDRLRRVRLGEHLREEELEEAAVVAQPVVAVVLRPALVGVELLVPRVARAARASGSPSGTAGQMKTAPSTRSGCSAASSSARCAPSESETSDARCSVPVASITASASAANSCSSYASAPRAGPSGRCRARRT